MCFLSSVRQPVDMWSIGVIIYTLLGGYPPFHDENQTRLFRRIKAGSFKFHDEYWSNTSDHAKVPTSVYIYISICIYIDIYRYMYMERERDTSSSIP